MTHRVAKVARERESSDDTHGGKSSEGRKRAVMTYSKPRSPAPSRRKDVVNQQVWLIDRVGSKCSEGRKRAVMTNRVANVVRE